MFPSSAPFRPWMIPRPTARSTSPSPAPCSRRSPVHRQDAPGAGRGIHDPAELLAAELVALAVEGRGRGQGSVPDVEGVAVVEPVGDVRATRSSAVPGGTWRVLRFGLGGGSGRCRWRGRWFRDRRSGGPRRRWPRRGRLPLRPGSSRGCQTSASKELSTGAHSWLVPLEVTPAKTILPPMVRKSGPPESPKQVSELVPGAPRGFRKFQQTKPSAGGSQGAVLTLPWRLMPSSPGVRVGAAVAHDLSGPAGAVGGPVERARRDIRHRRGQMEDRQVRGSRVPVVGGVHGEARQREGPGVLEEDGFAGGGDEVRPGRALDTAQVVPTDAVGRREHRTAADQRRGAFAVVMKSPTVGWRWSSTPLVIFSPSGCAGRRGGRG